ncbi:MAG: 30S ribosome-binding factor RbfA [Candidatus Omnitrophota bacterium]
MIERMKRVSEFIKREVALILEVDINDPRVKHVTITEVKVTKDLKLAKVFYVISGFEDQSEEIARGLKSAGGFIRKELAERMSMKYIPMISFAEDKIYKRNESVDRLFEKIEAEHSPEPEASAFTAGTEEEIIDSMIGEIKKRDNFLITSHINPEGDSVGSQIAFYCLLKAFGKKAVMVQQDEVPDNLRFLAWSGSVIHNVPRDFEPEALVVLDCPVKERTGDICGKVRSDLFTINIDHHISNEKFGDLNWVDPGSSSVGEMVFRLSCRAGVDTGQDFAAAVYTAILTDTGMFNYDNTSGRTHMIAGKLIENGLNPRRVYRELFENRSIHDVVLLGKALATLKVEEGGLLAHITLTKEMLAEEGVDYISTDEFINFPRSVKGVEVAVFFKELPASGNEIKVSFRSSGKPDVNLIASYFGGGGHPQASGCTLACGMEEAKEKVLGEVRKILREMPV